MRLVRYGRTYPLIREGHLQGFDVRRHHRAKNFEPYRDSGRSIPSTHWETAREHIRPGQHPKALQ